METFIFYIRQISKLVAGVFAILYVLNITGFEDMVLFMLLAILNNLGAREAAE